MRSRRSATDPRHGHTEAGGGFLVRRKSHPGHPCRRVTGPRPVDRPDRKDTACSSVAPSATIASRIRSIPHPCDCLRQRRLLSRSRSGSSQTAVYGGQDLRRFACMSSLDTQCPLPYVSDLPRSPRKSRNAQSGTRKLTVEPFRYSDELVVFRPAAGRRRLQIERIGQRLLVVGADIRRHREAAAPDRRRRRRRALQRSGCHPHPSHCRIASASLHTIRSTSSGPQPQRVE